MVIVTSTFLQDLGHSSRATGEKILQFNVVLDINSFIDLGTGIFHVLVIGCGCETVSTVTIDTEAVMEENGSTIYTKSLTLISCLLD